MALPQPYANPQAGDQTDDLRDILKEVMEGLPEQKCHLERASELNDWLDGDSEKFIPFRPAEDALSWLTRPKRVSFITRHAVDKLTSHLYKPGPKSRRITTDPDADAWYQRVCQ